VHIGRLRGWYSQQREEVPHRNGHFV